jgi:uncharacterized protein
MNAGTSIRVTRFTTVPDFAAAAEAFLIEREAANNLLLGIVTSLPREDEASFYLAVADQNELPKAVAIHTPGFRIVLSFPDRPSVAANFADDLANRSLPQRGVLGPPRSARAFARRWSALAGVRVTPGVPQLIYQSTKVLPPTGVAGAIRNATAGDRPLLAAWLRGFARDAMRGEDISDEEAGSRVDAWLGSHDAHVRLWQTDRPVSMAVARGSTPNGIRVGGVYTPPEYRRHGFASACVAALSQELLEGGRRFCFLFTDARNATSNHIYRAIGYQPVAEVEEIDFAGGLASG